jgi:uncharacterized protein (DUF849 family)
VIVQACLNGARPDGYHPRLPLTVEAIATDAAACVSAGAAEIHVHPRGPDGRESLSSVDETLRAVRLACPGTFVGVSTAAWIEGDAQRTRASISAWRILPDYASVNLSEHDGPAIIDLLCGMGVGVEAGLATVEDAERFVALPNCRRALRILIEIELQDLAKADAMAEGIAQVLSVRILDGQSFFTVLTRLYGILCGARINSAGLRVLGWRMGANARMAKQRAETLTLYSMRFRFFGRRQGDILLAETISCRPRGRVRRADREDSRGGETGAKIEFLILRTRPGSWRPSARGA